MCVQRVDNGGIPACVEACNAENHNAMFFGDLNDPESEVWKLLHQPHVISVLKPDMGNEPALHYLGLRREVV